MKSVKSSLYERLATQANNDNEYDHEMTALVKVKNEYLTKQTVDRVPACLEQPNVG